VSFLIPESGILDAIDISTIEKVYKDILDQTCRTFPDLMNNIRQEGGLGKEDLDKLRDFITNFEVKT
jgi:F0F1-type ATP synthase alpha subunit